MNHMPQQLLVHFQPCPSKAPSSPVSLSIYPGFLKFWYFGQHTSSVWGPLPCTAGCLAVPLAPAHQMAAGHPPHLQPHPVTAQNVSACCQMYPEGGGAKLPPGFTIAFVPFFTCISSPDRNLWLRSLGTQCVLIPATVSDPLTSFAWFSLEVAVFCFAKAGPCVF